MQTISTWALFDCKKTNIYSKTAPGHDVTQSISESHCADILARAVMLLYRICACIWSFAT